MAQVSPRTKELYLKFRNCTYLDINKSVKKLKSKSYGYKYLSGIAEMAMENNDIGLIVALSNAGYNVSKFENFVAESKDFAQNVGKSNKNRLSLAIAQTKKPKYISEFAKKVNGANIKILSTGMAETKDYKAIIQFAVDLPSFDKTASEKSLAEAELILAKSVAQSDNAEMIWIFYTDAPIITDEIEYLLYNAMYETQNEEMIRIFDFEKSKRHYKPSAIDIMLKDILFD